jgi:hypothetical protein
LQMAREVDLDYRWNDSYGHVSVRAPWSVRPDPSGASVAEPVMPSARR